MQCEIIMQYNTVYFLHMYISLFLSLVSLRAFGIVIQQNEIFTGVVGIRGEAFFKAANNQILWNRVPCSSDPLANEGKYEFLHSACWCTLVLCCSHPLCVKLM